VDEAAAVLGLPTPRNIYMQPENETETLDLLDMLDSAMAAAGSFWPRAGCDGCEWFSGQVATPDWAVALREHMMAAHHLVYRIEPLRQVMMDEGAHEEEGPR
jgi:hypothetical protein